jgi:hypothetical protein
MLSLSSHINLENIASPTHNSESELYRPSDRRLSAKPMRILADRGVSLGQRGGSLRP